MPCDMPFAEKLEFWHQRGIQVTGMVDVLAYSPTYLSWIMRVFLIRKSEMKLTFPVLFATENIGIEETPSLDSLFLSLFQFLIHFLKSWK
jgi:hypothetical protein